MPLAREALLAAARGHPLPPDAPVKPPDVPGRRSRPSDSAVRLYGRIGSFFSADRGLTFEYQPIVDIKRAGRPAVAFECLARGPRSTPLERPEALLRFFRERGEAADLDGFLLFSAIADAARIPGAPVVSFNVSAATVVDAGFPARLLRLVAGFAMPPARVVLDIGLPADFPDPDRLVAHSRELRSEGLAVCFDEEGPFTSSFSLLVDAAPDFVKLHGPVVRGLRRDTWAARALEAACALGRKVGYRVVAEGVESPEDLEAVFWFDVELGQGDFLAPPVSRAALRLPEQALPEQRSSWSGFYSR